MLIGIGAAVIIVLAIIIGTALSGGGNPPATPIETQQSTSLPTIDIRINRLRY